MQSQLSPTPAAKHRRPVLSTRAAPPPHAQPAAAQPLVSSSRSASYANSPSSLDRICFEAAPAPGAPVQPGSERDDSAHRRRLAFKLRRLSQSKASAPVTPSHADRLADGLPVDHKLVNTPASPDGTGPASSAAGAIDIFAADAQPACALPHPARVPRVAPVARIGTPAYLTAQASHADAAKRTGTRTSERSAASADPLARPCMHLPEPPDQLAASQ